MRKDLALLLAGVVSFDLGTMVVPAHAADAIFMKLDSLKATDDYLKFSGDEAKAKSACLAQHGTLVEYKGDHYCSTPKKASAASKAAVGAVAVPQ
jgi:hypothetical protein